MGTIRDPKSNAEAEKAKQLALRYLTYQPRSRKEIVHRLRKEGFCASAVNRAVETLERLRLINDLELARRWIGVRMDTRPVGRRRASEELRRRGIPLEVVEQALDEAWKDLDPKDIAAGLLRKQARRYRNLEPGKAFRRMIGFLARRGFEDETVRSVVNAIWREWNEDDIERDPRGFSEVL